jgi:hypothetical protein
MVFFPGDNMKPELMNGAPLGPVSPCNPSGCIHQHTVTHWFQHTERFAETTNEEPVVLYLMALLEN